MKAVAGGLTVRIPVLSLVTVTVRPPAGAWGERVMPSVAERVTPTTLVSIRERVIPPGDAVMVTVSGSLSTVPSLTISWAT